MFHKHEESKGSKLISLWVYQLSTGLAFLTTSPISWGEDGSFKGTVTLYSGSGITGGATLAYEFTCNKEQLQNSWREEKSLPVEVIKELFDLDLQPDPASGSQSGSTGEPGSTTGTGSSSGSHTSAEDGTSGASDGVQYGEGEGDSRTITPEVPAQPQNTGGL